MDQYQNEASTLKQQGFYDKAVWKRVRAMALQRDHYLCQTCLKFGRIEAAKEVHHIKPTDTSPELALVLSNLTSLCRPCHDATKEQKKDDLLPHGVRVLKV